MLLVDTYNVLHVTGVLPPELAGLDVPGLVRLIGRSRYAERATTLVCDGGSSRDSGVRMGRVSILFSGTEREADDLLEVLIDRYAPGAALTVVSSDKRVRKAARKRRAESLDSERFLQQLARDARAPIRKGPPVFATEIPLDPTSVGHWVREFGVGGWSPNVAGATPATRSDPPTEAADQSAKIPPPKPASKSQAKSPDPPPNPAQPATSPNLDVNLDPLLRAALEEWRGRLTLDDLDMRRWVDDVQPIKHRNAPRKH